jgi:hypothetical protein
MRTLNVSLLACLALIGGCANFATLQTAETMKKDKFELGLGATFTAYEAKLETTVTQPDAAGNPVTRTSTESTTFTVPALTVSGRYGLTDRLELHGVAWLPFGASAGGKYMLIGEPDENGFVFSPGLDISVPITVTVNDESSMLIDLYVPLHMGYRASDSFEVYWTPKYVLRVFGGDIGHAPGATVGVALGSDTTIMLEASMLYDTLSEKPIINAGVGVAFE